MTRLGPLTLPAEMSSISVQGFPVWLLVRFLESEKVLEQCLTTPQYSAVFDWCSGTLGGLGLALTVAVQVVQMKLRFWLWQIRQFPPQQVWWSGC